MATEALTEALNLPFPLSDLGPCKLSCFHSFNPPCLSPHWLFWSRYNDEIRHHRPLLFARNNGDSTMKENIKCALQGLYLCLHYKPFLVQFWGLVKIGDRRHLTTCDQPFALYWMGYLPDVVKGLCRYRKHCLESLIAVDEPSVEEAELGPPGRVFRTGSPEIVNNVCHYSSKEYPQRDLAVQYGKSYWALPVYQSPGNICIGVLEFLSSGLLPFFPRTACQDSLKKVGLTTTCTVSLSDYVKSSSCRYKANMLGHKKEINEINEALGVLHERHQIRVARRWIEANSEELLTVLDQGFYGPFDVGFCFIQKGHGVVGKAFSSQSACFCTDVRQLSTTEDPSVPNARKCGYSSCFAICLRSFCSNSCIYTLEFVLPTNQTNSEDPSTLLHVIMEILKQHLGSFFKVASGQELGHNFFVEVIKVSSDDKLDSFRICHATRGKSTPRVVEVQNQVGMIPPDGSYQQVHVANNFVRDNDAQQNMIVGSPPTLKFVQNVVSITHQQPIEELDATIPARNYASMEQIGNEATNLRKRGSVYTLECARGITLKDLQQRSAMKLVDAAEDLGVSRSTLKRICRKYDILRWPPRKSRKHNQATAQQEIAQHSKKSTGEHSMSVATRLQDDSSIIVKATYEDTIIKFQLSLSARKTDLDEKVSMRLDLPDTSFEITYWDEEDDPILIKCDEDLSLCLSTLRSEDERKASANPKNRGDFCQKNVASNLKDRKVTFFLNFDAVLMSPN